MQLVVLLLIIPVHFIRDLKGRRMRIAQIDICVLWYFLLKAVSLDVPS